ncbi:MAG: PIN domain-containing protein [Bacteroidetes bacterium]|nr:PIN domain-containing protein [Bacteroidota bacterium]
MLQYSSNFIVVLDANVLFPAPIRDLLMNLACEGLYQPKWSTIIQEEWVRNLLEKRPDLLRSQLSKTVDAMNETFPDANIKGFEELINGLTLPDQNDRHILAAAIRSKSEVIVTFNSKDFPKDYLKNFDIEIQHPDLFVNNLINLDNVKAMNALNNQVKRLVNPSRTNSEVLGTLEKCGLIQSAKIFRELSIH